MQGYPGVIGLPCTAPYPLRQTRVRLERGRRHSNRAAARREGSFRRFLVEVTLRPLLKNQR
jgi:hypothetical protein